MTEERPLPTTDTYGGEVWGSPILVESVRDSESFEGPSIIYELFVITVTNINFSYHVFILIPIEINKKKRK